MNVNGIIAEYNPFHNGHKYHLEDAKKITGADYTIIVMSGNFMQRGTPAIINKYKRTEMALRNGADLVLELPTYYSISSAEYFATGSVALLDKLGVVDHLCFGSECGNLPILEKIAKILLEEPEDYVKTLRMHLREGLSYPAARNWALIQADPSLSDYKDVFSSPNNILGIEYIKALQRRNSSLSPVTTKRAGSDYRDIRLGEKQSSALAIRQAVYSREDRDFLKDQMPESAYDIMIQTLEEEKPMSLNVFSSMLHYKLLSESETGYTKYLDVTPDLSDRIRKNLYQYTGFRGFCDLLKSKDMTYTRISRCLMHILLGMTTEKMNAYKNMDYVPYARVLGFKKEAQPLLNNIKSSSSIPLIVKLADAEQTLSPEAYNMLKEDLYMNSIYESAASLSARKPMLNEYRTPMVII